MSETVTIPKAEYDALIARVRRQAAQITQFQQAMTEKNLLLDALHMVWCSGACYGGVHRYEDRPVTEELVKAAERNTARLRSWFDSVRWRQTVYPTTSEYIRRIETKVPRGGVTNVSKTPAEAIHAALDERGFYAQSCQEASEVAADAVPDGWAKIDGQWVRWDTPATSGADVGKRETNASPQDRTTRRGAKADHGE